MRLASSNYRLVPVYNVFKDLHSESCGDPCDEVMKVRETAYPPFQLISDVDLGIPSSVRLQLVCGGGDPYELNWANSCARVTADIDDDGVNEYVYTFQGGVGTGVPGGVYYVKIEFPDVTYYIEKFKHEDECPGCESNWWLEWSHSCDDKGLGYYSAGFKNRLDLGNIILYRDGEIENVESRRDGYGVETVIFSDIRPKMTFDIKGNSWLLDSLKYLKLYDEVFLKRSDNGDVFKLDNIQVDAKGDTEECEFGIKISFTKDALITSKCCDSVYEQAPVPANCAGMHVMTSDDFSICAGDSTPLTATIIGGSAPYVYIWSNGDFGPDTTVTPSETTTYIVTAVDAFGCAKQDEVTVTVVTCEGDLELTIDADPGATICAGVSVDLDLTVTGGSGTYTYLWSTGATTQDITVTPAATMVYSVTVTDTISGDIQTASINIVVQQLPAGTIIATGCYLQLQVVSACEGSPAYLWQVETSPGVWATASGPNTGMSYMGENGKKYRLSITCGDCTGYTNAITVACTTPCTINIDSITYNSEEGNVGIVLSGTPGSSGFITGYIVVYESETPDPGNCAASGGYAMVITYTLTSFGWSGFIEIPFTPEHLPGCVKVYVNINAGECEDTAFAAIGV